MKRNTKIKLLSSIMLLNFTSLVLSVAYTVSWYFDPTKQETNMGAQIHGSYFESGDGSAETPYEIHTPMQLYYFSWLQGLGYFNELTSEDQTQIKQYHFYLSADLDMSGIILPPIGTAEYPFVGEFTGKDKGSVVHQIKNLTISNDKVSYSDIPVTTEEFSTPEIIGFFGVVGSLDGDKQVTVNGKYGEELKQNCTYDSSVLSIRDFYINGCTIEAKADNALIGIVAGYANGPMSGVGVVDSNLYVKTSTKPLTSITNNISDYSIIGYATESFITEVDADPSTETIKIDAEPEKVPVPDAGNAWGGSIDMHSIYKRLDNIYLNNNLSYSYNGTNANKVTYVSERNFEYDIDGNLISQNEISKRMNQYGFQYGGIQTANKFYNSDSANGSYAIFHRDIRDSSGFTLGGPCDDEKLIERHIHHTGNMLNGFKFKSNNYFLNLNNTYTTINATTAENSALTWTIENQTGTGPLKAILPATQDADAYLNINTFNGEAYTLSVGQNSSTNWVLDGNQIYYLNQNVRYYLMYIDGAWTATRTDGFYLTDGTNYIQATSNTAIGTTANQNNASLFFANGASNSTITTYRNNAFRFLTFNSSNASNPMTLTNADTNSATVHTRWNLDENGVYYDNTHYIIYKNNTWTCGTKTEDFSRTGYYITDGNNNYLSANSGFTGLINVTDPNQATKWDIANNRITVVNNNTTYYLRHNNNALSLSITNNNADWTLNNNSITYTGGNIFNRQTYYLGFNNTNSTWRVSTTNSTAIRTQVNYIETAIYTFAKKTEKSFAFNENVSVSQYEDLDIDIIEKPAGFPCYFPINAEETGAFNVKGGNTGYILSGSNERTQNYRSDIRITSWQRSNLGEGLDNNGQIVENKIYTFDSRGNHQLSNDDIANYAKFESSKLGFQTILDEGYKETISNKNNYIFGLHFMDASISKDRTLIVPEVVINNTTYHDYELPIDSIDFNLQTQGYVNFYGGSYFVSGNTIRNDSFFSLHEIFREGNLITDIKEIQGIYACSDVTEPFAYKYKNDNNYYINKEVVSDSYISEKNYTLKFNTDWITKPELTLSQTYYYEIPVNAGEYALGSVPGRTGAYLNYLDISANKQMVDRAVEIEQEVETVNSYSYVNGVAFVENVGDEVDPLNSSTYSLGSNYSSSTTNGTNYKKEDDEVSVTPDDGVILEYPGGSNSPGRPTMQKYTTTTSIINEDTNKALDCLIITEIKFIDKVTQRGEVKTNIDRTIIVNHYKMAKDGTFKPTDGSSSDAILLLSYRIENFDALNNGFNYQYYLDGNSLNLFLQFKVAVNVNFTFIADSPYTFKVNSVDLAGTPTIENPITRNIAATTEPFTPIFSNDSDNSGDGN